MPKAKAEPVEYERPAPGIHQAVCVDVIDLEYQMTPWGAKHKVRVIWETDEPSEKWDNNITVAKTYTLSLHEKSNLSQDLENWRGRSFTAEERREGFEIENLLGAACTLNIVHKEMQDGGIFAAVGAVMPADPNSPMEATGHYRRVQDRVATKEPVDAEEFTYEPDDELPF